MRQFVVILVLGLAWQAQAPPPLAPGNGIVVVRLVEAGTSTVVPGAVVTLNGPALGSTSATFTDGTPSGSRRGMSDGQGRVVFHSLPAGPYNITATATGFVNGAYGQTRVVQIPRSLDVTRPLDLTDADRPATVTIQMWKYGGIGGMVRDELGEPMVGVPVSVLSRVTDWGGVVMQQAGTYTTDDRGMYHADVVPGDYLVAVLAATTTIPASASDAFQRAFAGGSDTQQAYMEQMNAAGGILPRGNGTRVGNMLVNQWGEFNASAVPPILATDGRPMMYPTTFYPSSTTAATASVVTAGSGTEKSGINLDLRPVVMRRISGRVLGPADAAANIVLRLVPADPAAATRMSPPPLIDTPQTMANGSGDFTFIGIAPGAYRLRVIRMPVRENDPLFWNADTVTVADADISDLQVALQPGVRVSGRVEIDSSGSTSRSPDLRSMVVTPRPLPGSAGALQTITSIDRVGDSGRFTTRPVIPGPYMMTISGIPAGWMLKSVTTGGQDAVDTQFDLPSTGIGDMVVTITDRISTLGGFALNMNGQPTGSATVGVFPTSRALWRVPGMGSRRVQVSLPARDGRYSFRGLPAGEYFVVAVDGAAVDFSDPATLTQLIASASRVPITDGESKTQDLRVTTVKQR